ncbi:hypothetical protein SLEP1_g54999 [Rubroshorea leprosula]|uniref:Uncharacterized protein n=1 Tax=Rubroshorea leprosula TaxID=152421 RepID=A0AAV5ME49_9ROSI|nr:hypothetical protein SLEP1_g54999 [Rubroshorea leprosula]
MLNTLNYFLITRKHKDTYKEMTKYQKQSKDLSNTSKDKGCNRVVMDWLSASARLMIVSDLDHTMVNHHDVENVSLLCCYIYHSLVKIKKSLVVWSVG